MIFDLLWHVVRELKGVLMGMTINMDGEKILYKCRMHNHLKKSHTQPQRCRRQQRVPHRRVSSPCLLPPPLVVLDGLAIAPARIDVVDGNGHGDGKCWRRQWLQLWPGLTTTAATTSMMMDGAPVRQRRWRQCVPHRRVSLLPPPVVAACLQSPGPRHLIRHL